MSEHKIKSFHSLDKFLKAVIVDRKTLEEGEEAQLITESAAYQETVSKQVEAVKNMDKSDRYVFYRDRDDIIELKITSLKGANIAQVTARIVMEGTPWNLVFPGKVYSDARVVVPVRKLSVYDAGMVGKMTLEIIVDGTVFSPWEETFVVEEYKKVEVKKVGKPAESE